MSSTKRHMLGVRMDYDLLKALKREALERDTTVNSLVVQLVKKEIKHNN